MVVCQTSAKPEHHLDSSDKTSKSLSQQQNANPINDDLEKRSGSSWAKAGSMWGKRNSIDESEGENEYESNEELQKRGWEKAGSMWGKRATNTWSKASSMWGKRAPNTWSKASSMWGKRAPNTWSKASSMWGKRQLINNMLDTSNPSAERE